MSPDGRLLGDCWAIDILSLGRKESITQCTDAVSHCEEVRGIHRRRLTDHIYFFTQAEVSLRYESLLR